MRLYGLVFAIAGCASAETPGSPIDAAVDASKRDAAITYDVAPDAMNLCPSAMTCASAMMLGTVSGDTGNGRLTATGHQSAWFRVRVTEDFSDFPGLALRVASKVTSPPGVQFDTFVYVNAGADQVECATTTGTKSNMGAVTQVRAEWGESTVPNGGDDSRDVSIEVRPVGTNCTPAQQWQLEIEGNWI